MRWFSGNIADAVKQAKQCDSVFVVLIEGDDEQSKQLCTLVDSEQITNKLSETQNFLSVKIKSGSTDYTHFAQIYQFVPVPSLFFIGRKGEPIEVICSGVQADDLSKRIDRIIMEHKQGATASTKIFLKGESDVIAEDAKAAKAGGPSTSDDYEMVCDGDVCVRRPKAAAISQPSTSSQSIKDILKAPVIKKKPTEEQVAAPHAKEAEVGKQESKKESNEQEEASVAEKKEPVEKVENAKEVNEAKIGEKELKDKEVIHEIPVVEEKASEEKVEHAKEVIEARRREKELKEKELAKQRELERRAAGQGVAELKRWQADQEMKQIQEERKRERIENEMARKRILDQIAQDRAERKAKENTSPPQPTRAPANPEVLSNPIGDTPTARLSFKTPDGSTNTKIFEAANTLSDIRIYVADTFKMPASSFTLWINFPRRQLIDDVSTLQQLGLTPSAVILILRDTGGNFSSDRRDFPASLFSYIASILTTLIFKPAQNLYAWITNYVYPRPPLRSPEPGARPDLRPEPRQGLRYRPRTNVHRLAEENDDDENGTWNGNSTQQM